MASKNNNSVQSMSSILYKSSNNVFNLISQLMVGDSFGALDHIDKDPNSRVLTVLTEDANCEFMKISCTDYERVMDVSLSLCSISKCFVLFCPMICLHYSMSKGPHLKFQQFSKT